MIGRSDAFFASMDVLLSALSHGLKPWLLSLILPPGPPLLLLLSGALLLRRRPALARSCVWLGTIGVWLGCTSGAAAVAQLALLGRSPALTASQLRDLRLMPATAVLVLGGGARQEAVEYGGPTLKPLTMERLRYGAWLARQSGLPLAFSGGIGWSGHASDASEASLAARIAEQEFGLPLLFAEGGSRDTRQNAALSMPLLRAHGIRHVLLVTHELHMARSLRAFAELDGELKLTAAPLALLPSGPPNSLGDWLPSAEGYARMRYVLYEWLGLRLGH